MLKATLSVVSVSTIGVAGMMQWYTEMLQIYCAPQTATQVVKLNWDHHRFCEAALMEHVLLVASKTVQPNISLQH